MAKNICFGRIIEEGDNPGFFKILRKEEDLLSETMRGIPYNFMRSISNMESSLKMVLTLPWGSSWPIKVLRNSRFYYMEKRGWEKFLSENALGDDEFLTFTHIGNLCVNVNIYQRDSKEMLRPKITANIASSKTSESSTRRRLRKKSVEEGENSYLKPEFTLTIKKSNLLSLVIPKMFAKMHMPKERKMFKIHDLKEKKTWEVTYVLSDKQSRLSPGWVHLVKDLGLVVGDVCTFKLTKPTEIVLNVSKKTTPSSK